MWQILWMVGLIPNWIFHVILILGIFLIIAGNFLRMLPLVSQHSVAIKFVGIVFTVIGIWFNGSISADTKWKVKVAELEEKVRVAEAKSAEANIVIETVYVDKIKVVKEVQYRNVTNIKANASGIDANCTISPKVVEILNNSATSGKRK